MKMPDKVYQPQTAEPEITQLWEKEGCFVAKIDQGKKPFSIILPLPNANDPMHIGHAMFVIQDVLARYHRMLGDSTLWLPGADHAGIETQFVFEKKLAREGKSRFDFDRNTLYQMIWDFVEENRRLNQYQLKRLGFSLDWTRYHYSLEPEIVEKVFAAFRQLCQDGLVYRAERLVNYCPECGTAFSELEIEHPEKEEFLYYLDYGSIQIATTRPETIFADVAIAVNPQDQRYSKLVGQKATVPLTSKEIPIIADQAIKSDFGTGALKVTPGHDQTDFEIGERHQLPVISCISLAGRMINVPAEIKGLPVKTAKEKTIQLLKQADKLMKEESLHHTVSTCYKCDNPIEPLLTPQWYVKTQPLAEPVVKAVTEGQTKFFPLRFKKILLDWMRAIKDWNIGRQIVWGPRIPAWYCLDCQPNIYLTFLDAKKKLVSGTYTEIRDKYQYSQIAQGLQSLRAPVNSVYLLEDKGRCPKCGQSHLIQETDTFDTWFLSGQWPLNTLGINLKNPQKSSADFKYFYPTSVMDTLWDILFFWVARMLMLGLYLANKVPFKLVHLHSRVVDQHGQKMSKSKGNVVDVSAVVDQYGADALRMALVFGTAPASDIVVSEDKIRAMRNFANKVWNIGRYFSISTAGKPIKTINLKTVKKEDREILKQEILLTRRIIKLIEGYRFGQAGEVIYEFIWHRLADQYLEKTKNRLKNGDENAIATFFEVYKTCLKLLHPFMPFVTEKIWQTLPGKETGTIALSAWPGQAV